MNNLDTNELIKNLVEDSKPVRPIWSPKKLFVVWFVSSLAISSFIVTSYGPYRKSFRTELLSHPHFLVEVLLAVLCGVVSAYLAFEMIVPGKTFTKLKKRMIFLPFVIYSGIVLTSFFFPALEPSWDGWRFGCEREILIAGLIPMFCFFILAKRGAVIESRWTGALIGIAAMAPPAALMYLACMYATWHTTIFHIGPVLIAALIGSLLGPRLFRV